MKRWVFLFILSVIFAPPAAEAQTLATMTTGSVSGEGEGGLFMLAGTNVSRLGIMSRFALSRNVDMGVQLAFDRYEDKGFFGGGIDLKFELPIDAADLPMHIALDLGIGDLESSERRRSFLEAGCIVSGVVESSNRTILEPYAGIYVLTTRSGWKDDCTAAGTSGCWEGTRSETDALLRGGARILLRDDLQILVEMNLDGEAMFGAGINVVF
jgi:hypothetical protein